MQLFNSYGKEPDFVFEGDVLSQFRLKKRPHTHVLLSITDTSNKNIKLVHIYIDGVRRGGSRYNKSRLGIFEVDTMLNRIYWEYICRTLD